jgi:ketosteroid isomerase-like protein
MLMPGFRPPAARHSDANGPSASIGAYARKAGKAPRARFSAAAWPLVAATLLLAATVMLAACRHTPPEQALRETISTMQAAGEARDMDALFEPIADDFAGAQGMDRKEFRRYMTLMAMRQKSVGVTLGPVEVKLFGDRATARFTAAITGGPGFLPSQAQIYEIDTGWRLDGDDWKLISARWNEKL